MAAATPRSLRSPLLLAWVLGCLPLACSFLVPSYTGLSRRCSAPPASQPGVHGPMKRRGARWRRCVSNEGLGAEADPPDEDDEEEDPYLKMALEDEDEDLEEGTEVRTLKSWYGETSYLFREESVELWKKLNSTNQGPRPYFKEMAAMAAEAAVMPMDFMNHPEVAYYRLGKGKAGDEEGLKTCRLITGTWQLDGLHGYHPFYQDVKRQFREMMGVDGYTTFDVAPFYGHVERWLGEVRATIKDLHQRDAFRLYTKYSPPLQLDRLTPEMMETVVDGSLQRMKLDRLDLLQLHWWDFEDQRYLDALEYLTLLQEKGKLRHIGVTNWDAEHLRIALDAGFPIVSNQVQYSLIDQRPARELTELCQERNVTLLCYGTLLGGFLSDRYLGVEEPDPATFQSSSEEKYFEMIRAWGSWSDFQDLLSELKSVARKHRSCIAHVAMRWVLDRPAVGSVIVGTRLGFIDHLQDNKEVLKLTLSESDRYNLMRATRVGRSLFDLVGEVGEEYRRAIRPDWASEAMIRSVKKRDSAPRVAPPPEKREEDEWR